MRNEEEFSENSFGLRTNRGGHDALKRPKEIVEGGYG